mmetsp:Transcript_53065/g.124012  ORF Transcript_53065/g.124012 Transcript_53065/m.124012 type:complete len:217 (+) Transcript_53065:239-889(+)
MWVGGRRGRDTGGTLSTREAHRRGVERVGRNSHHIPHTTHTRQGCPFSLLPYTPTLPNRARYPQSSQIVISVVLTLSASANARTPSGPSSFAAAHRRRRSLRSVGDGRTSLGCPHDTSTRHTQHPTPRHTRTVPTTRARAHHDIHSVLSNKTLASRRTHVGWWEARARHRGHTEHTRGASTGCGESREELTPHTPHHPHPTGVSFLSPTIHPNTPQ